jgi:hypothetical protein
MIRFFCAKAKWALTHFLDLGIIQLLPPGITPDSAAAGGLYGLWSNINNYAELSVPVTTAVPTPISVAQLLAGVTILNAGAGGAFIIQLPATTAIISALGATIPYNSTFAMIVSFMNNAVGQTGTVTIGDASTTLTGTATVATNTRRQYLLTVTSFSTITLQNLGTMAL